MKYIYELNFNMKMISPWSKVNSLFLNWQVSTFYNSLTNMTLIIVAKIQS